MKSSVTLITFILLINSLTSCYYDKEDILYQNKPACDTTGLSFTNNIYSIINTNCNKSGCHDAITVSGGLNFVGYANIKAHINEPRFLGTIKHDPLYLPMPQLADKLSECDIMKIEQWKNNGAPNN